MKIRTVRGTKETLSEITEDLRLRGVKKQKKVQDKVQEILIAVKEKGDEAVLSYTKIFDGVDLSQKGMSVSKEEMEAAIKSVPEKLLDVMKKSASNIRDFHERQRETGFQKEITGGGFVRLQVCALNTAGIYIPGGTAPLPSTVLMNVIPAKVAGVRRIVLCTPPGKDGEVPPVILAAAGIAGADEIYKVGGAQAIAAMAYGTQSIPRTDKICGPGNVYVNTAKRLVFGEADIDMFAGPSEILIVADRSANPEYVAADMLSQAEHDILASAILVTDDAGLAKRVGEEIIKRGTKLPRRDILELSLEEYGCIVTVPDLDAAISFANTLAPEHLELCVEKAESRLPEIFNAGAVFLGNHSPEPLGDYFAGPNHTLPTSGTARFFSLLSTGDFVKKMSVISYEKEALRACFEDVALFARAEGLEGHAQAVEVRFK